MSNRGMSLKTFGEFPAEVISGKSEEKKELIIPEAAVLHLAEALAKGGKITRITIHYSTPALPGMPTRGVAYLETPAECDWKLK